MELSVRRLFFCGQAAPLLFESTRLCESDICAKENRQCISTPAVFSWARVDYASRAAKNSLAGCFCPAGRKAPGRSCSHPPAYVSLTFAQKKTASVSLHQRFFHGRGWITQAALLKTARWAVFALSSATAPQLFESTLAALYKLPDKTETPVSLQHWSSWWARVDSNHRS